MTEPDETEQMRADLHLDDFSVKQQKSGTIVKKYYGEALLAAARADSSILAISADLTAPTETDLIRDQLPDQFMMAGIAEANMIGVAAGLARTGFTPFAHSFSVFLSRRSFDQIAMQVAYPKTNVKLVGFMPGIDSMLGVSHQAIDDLALMRALPNMTVLEPGSPADYADAVKCALAHQGPVYLRLWRATESAPAAFAGAPLQRGKIRHLFPQNDAENYAKNDAAIFASGLMVDLALAAAQSLAADNIYTAVIDCASIKPLDCAGVLAVINSVKAVVTAENHTVIGGLGSAIAEVMADNGVARPFHRIGVQDCFAEGGSRKFLFEKHGLSAANIVAKVKQGLGHG